MIHFLCESRFRGVMVGDGMGLGKTYQAILELAHVSNVVHPDEPGCHLIVCPEGACLHWKNSVDSAFTGVSAYLLLCNYLVHVKNMKRSKACY